MRTLSSGAVGTAEGVSVLAVNVQLQPSGAGGRPQSDASHRRPLDDVMANKMAQSLIDCFSKSALIVQCCGRADAMQQGSEWMKLAAIGSMRLLESCQGSV